MFSDPKPFQSFLFFLVPPPGVRLDLGDSFTSLYLIVLCWKDLSVWLRVCTSI